MDNSGSNNPMYAYTLSRFISAGKSNQIIKYSDFCFKERLGYIDFVTKNILRDYIPDLKEYCVKVTLSSEEQQKYQYNPKKLAGDIYGYTDLYYVILMLNGMIDVKEFKNISTLNMLSKENMNYFLSKIYTAEQESLSRYNSLHT